MKKMYIVLSVLLICLSLLTYKTNEKNKINLKLILKGDKIITLNLGQKYQESGYNATLNGKNVNKKVTVNSNLQNKPGTYEITYKIKYKNETATAYRFIKIKNKPAYKEEYDQIENQNRGWWSNNKKNKTRPSGGADINELKKYNAYFMGKNEKTLYLTFDEGGNNTYLKEILEILNQNNVKATFFLCKNYILNNKDLINKMVDTGHTIGNHTWHHLNMPSLATKENFEKYIEEIQSTEEAYSKITGKQMEKIYRDPRGEWSFRDLQIMKDLGYKSFFYSADYHDYDENVTKEKALAELEKRVHNGAIYLIHPKNKGNYLALDTFIKGMKKQGYKFDLVKNIN